MESVCLVARHVQVSQIACSQQGRRKALTASLLQMAHRSLMGMSSGLRELLGGIVSDIITEKLKADELDQLELSWGNCRSHVVDKAERSGKFPHGRCAQARSAVMLSRD